MILNPTLTKLPNIKTEEGRSLFTIFKYIFWSLKLNFKLLPLIITLRIAQIFYNNVEPIIHGYIWGRFIDALISKDIDQISSLFTIYLFVLGFSFVMGVIKDRIDNFGQHYSKFKYKIYFSEIISKLGIPALESAQINNQVYRINESYDSLWSLTKSVSSFISIIITVALSVSLVLNFQPIYAGIILILVFLRSFFHGRELREDWKFTSSHTENKRIGDGLINSVLHVESLKELLLSKSTDFFKKKYEEFYGYYYKVTAGMRIRKSIVDSLFEILSVIVLGFLLHSFIREYLNDSITIGEITFYLSAFKTYIYSLKGLFSAIVVIGESKDRVRDAYDISHMKTDEESSRTNSINPNTEIDIQFKNVNFTYPNSTHEVISDLNLEIKKGEKIAIVGENGAGKSTLLSLLLGFYPVTSGEILVNNLNLNSIKLESLYINVGMLMQSFEKYDFLSLRDNITFGKKDKGRLDKILKMFSIEEILYNYEYGLKQVLSPKYSNGTSPSGGQWQKIAMARTMFRDTSIVILDEPTSAMDPISETAIFTRLFEELKGKTVIIISHRFSTVKKADTIVAMKDGRIVEKGTHRQLMSIENGVYAHSYNLQANSYKD